MLESIIKKIFETVLKKLFEFVVERSVGKIMKSIIEYSKLKKEEILKVAKPILFNTDMVTAILDGRKTVTRRLLKLPRNIKEQEDGLYTLFAEGTCYENHHLEEIVNYIKPPYKAGDYLYIRETWSTWTDGYVYRAWTSPFPQPGRYPDEFMTWHPSIHMPKEAARIFLRVTDAHLERLKDLAVGDLMAEGIECSGFLGEHPTLTARDLFSRFEEIWNSTIPKKDLDKYGWNANPWVFVYEYKRIIPLEAIKNSEGGKE